MFIRCIQATLIIGLTCAGLLASAPSFSCTTASCETTPQIHPDFAFEQNPANLQQVIATQEQAKANNKHLLVVLGATWCKDSQALATQLSEPRFYAAVKQRYEVATVNTGYFAAGFDVANQFGLPIYFGTPTVLIIEPNSGDIVNRIDFHNWMNAKSKSSEAYWSYFIEQEFSQGVDASAPVQQQISAYEAKQATRLHEAYAVAGQLLQEYVESGQQPSERFTEVWFELADYRNKVAQAVSEARKSNNAKNLPSFPHSFVWELSGY